MLLLVDLDQTLIDRTAAFRRWAVEWIPAHGGSAADVAWAIEADEDGYAPRPRLAAELASRLLSPCDLVLEQLILGTVEHLSLDPAVAGVLQEAVAAGWSPVVVTNGSVRQQEAKLRRTGLDELVAGWVVSEGAGVRKPDRRIFELGAATAGLDLANGGWMIGDNPADDIAGAAAAGLRTVWLHRGRQWPGLDVLPTRTADDFPSALRGILCS
ncbi:HAD family hydrolase [Symbioplanes lichenis]|uniref:HAD family hydrolase n=1 Tax=Symbioplanes lichenis TaxID=1629072 RepID=UPI002738A354|nr:HAD family hydrolase [Actinoplanes lichenis]